MYFIIDIPTFIWYPSFILIEGGSHGKQNPWKSLESL